MKFLSVLKRRDSVDLERHDQILREMKQVTENLRRAEPITRMVRGEWHNGHDEESEREEDND